MLNESLQIPDPDELEISLFGPGYGEALAIHLGNTQWILVDSCINPITGIPASVEYLERLSVDAEKNVPLVVVTHWHDDHVRGISSIFRKCKSARLVTSAAIDEVEFLKLLGLYLEGGFIQTSGLDEYASIFRTLEERRIFGMRFNPPTHALSDRLLYQTTLQTSSNSIPVKVYSLSPSDASIIQAKLSFSKLFPNCGERKKRIGSLSPNHASVVLVIQVGTNEIILGADLEVTNVPNTGWMAILDESVIDFWGSQIYKVPHHGSNNAHSDRVWNELLKKDVYAILTPFQLGTQVLPTIKDQQRLSGLTNNCFATAQTSLGRHRWRNRVVRDFAHQATRNLRSVNAGWGHIRLRKSANDQSMNWRIELFGDSYAI